MTCFVLLANHVAISTTAIAAQRITSSWPWYIIRGAGFTAAGLLALLTLTGIAQVTGLMYRFFEPMTAWAIHKALAIALCMSIAVHIGFLLIDHFIRFSILQIFIPFTSQYNNGTRLWGLAFGTLAVAMGILALYGVMVLVASSLGWIDTKPRAWHRLHYASYAVAILIFLHALYSGSDLKHGILRDIWLAVGGLIFVGIISRLWRSGTTRSRRPNADKPEL